MTTSHTPGPWIIWADKNGRLQAGPSTNYTVAEMCLTPLEGQQANARLIAAAPDLLEALKDLAQSIVWKEFGECRGFSDSMPLPVITAVEKARAAIAKAEGKA